VYALRITGASNYSADLFSAARLLEVAFDAPADSFGQHHGSTVGQRQDYVAAGLGGVRQATPSGLTGDRRAVLTATAQLVALVLGVEGGIVGPSCSVTASRDLPRGRSRRSVRR